MLYGFLALFCWLFLLCAAVAFPIFAVRKNRPATAVLFAFLAGGLLAGALVFQTTRPPDLSIRESLRAGLTNEGLRQYGHPIEHWAEVAICLSTYAWVLGGAICAGAAHAGMRVTALRKTA